MSAEKPVNWVVITVDGRVWRSLPGKIADWPAQDGYFAILDAVYAEYQSAGGGWDRPNKLLLNGIVVTEKGLSETAWKYGRELNDATLAAAGRVKEINTPGFLK